MSGIKSTGLYSNHFSQKSNVTPIRLSNPKWYVGKYPRIHESCQCSKVSDTRKTLEKQGVGWMPYDDGFHSCPVIEDHYYDGRWITNDEGFGHWETFCPQCIRQDCPRHWCRKAIRRYGKVVHSLPPMPSWLEVRITLPKRRAKGKRPQKWERLFWVHLRDNISSYYAIGSLHRGRRNDHWHIALGCWDDIIKWFKVKALPNGKIRYTMREDCPIRMALNAASKRVRISARAKPIYNLKGFFGICFLAQIGNPERLARLPQSRGRSRFLREASSYHFEYGERKAVQSRKTVEKRVGIWVSLLES
jgi:hypothetical protein